MTEPGSHHDPILPLAPRSAQKIETAGKPLLGIVSELMRLLMEAVDIGTTIARSLEQLGQSLGLAGVALYEGVNRENLDSVTMSLCHLWGNEQVSGVPVPRELRASDVFANTKMQFDLRSTLDDGEENGSPLYCTCLPILQGGSIVACLALFLGEEQRSFSNYEISLLTALAASFGSALLRQHAQGIATKTGLRYQQISESKVVGMFRTALDGRFLEANDALAHWLGFDGREELLELDARIFYPSEDLRDKVLEELRRLGSITFCEVELRRKDGSPVWVFVNGILLDGGVIEGTMIDISDHKRSQKRALRREKLQALRVLAGGIAHDFNNLLTSLIGNVSLAREIVRGQDTLSRILDMVESATVRAQDMASQLLTFARGGQPIRRIVDVESSVLDAVQLSLLGSKVHCDLQLEEGIGTIFADSGQWHQVLCNLLINSAQAMSKGGSIRITGRREQGVDGGDGVSLCIADQGPGIAEEILDKVFDPFFTTKKDGSGLGLAICHSVLERHGGRIDIEVPAEGGTAFHIWMPAGEVEEPETVPAKDRKEPMQGWLLLMDDREDVRDIGETMLGHLGFRVDSFENGEAAVAAYREAMQQGRRYDAVILDLRVPEGMGGVETLQAIREIDPKVLAFVSSGYSSDPVMANYEFEGFHGVIGKPYRLRDLRQALSPHFGEGLK
ncbi:MAG: hypothetical protein CSA62_11410 [Planctomycetota bacterium]|nr:MAG: hypothetical protein CSA62_11410 [Planctomycetota bacterium]